MSLVTEEHHLHHRIHFESRMIVVWSDVRDKKEEVKGAGKQGSMDLQKMRRKRWQE
jgi:hypothetical protein